MNYKSTKRILLLTIIAMLLFIASASFASFLGVNSKFYRSISKDLNIIAYSSNPYTYYLYDANGASTGHYTNASTIEQKFKVRSTPAQTIYQIRIPVTEAGYYSLNFNVDFIQSGKTATDMIYNSQMTKVVGCMIVHSDQERKPLVLMATDPTIEHANDRNYYTQRTYSSDDRYLWKTLAPSLAEDVSLTLKVTESDVETGYVLWSWELTALAASTEYTIQLNRISMSRIDELDESNKNPYFNFAQTNYVNNVVYPNTTDTTYEGSSVGGYSIPGYTRHAQGKGTFVTNATANSLTMQVAPLFAAWDNKNNKPMLGSDNEYYENHVGIEFPLKNIEFDTNYKVSFDFSIARQGTRETHTSATAQADVLYDSNFDNFFHDFADSDTDRTLTFQSFLHSGLVVGRTANALATGKAQIKMANKLYPNVELTKYAELRKYNSTSTSYKDYGFNSKTNINNLNHSRGGTAGMLNLVQHKELNGQNQLYWLTFYNTTFTFNIPKEKNSSRDLNDLYWFWSINALYPSRYFRIKIENARIEKVVQFGSDISMNGIKINGQQVTNFNNVPSGYSTENYLRGASGTGQNYQALAYGTTESMAAINTFAPIYDAATCEFTSYSNNDFKIELDGYCVTDGGIEKYVWSPDLGNTWHDMIIQQPLSQVGLEKRNLAERRVDQRQIPYEVNGVSKGSQHNSSLDDDASVDFVTFTEEDTKNSDFTGFKLCADISEYKHISNLEIIFAAVPADHPDMKCEILRITNANPKQQYRGYIDEIISDIQVVKDYTTYSGGTGNYQPTDLYASNIDDVVDTTTETANIKAVVASSALSSTSPTEAFGRLFSPVKTRTTANNLLDTTGYYSTDNPNSLYETRTLFSGFPIKRSITLKGWTINKGGTDSFWFSVDNGKNWSQITTTALVNPSVTTTKYVESWQNLFGLSVTAEDLINGEFTLTIDLSAYEGKLINLLVASKPNGKDIYCPIAKIDNISVRGDYLFLSRIRQMTLTQGAGASDLVISNSSFVKYTTFSSTFAYSSLEPYNVELFATRKLTPLPVPINNGGTISLQGFIYGYGGIKGYKYTLDGGKTWTNLSQYDNNYFAYPNSTIFKSSKLIDWNMNVSSGKNGNFDSSFGATKPFNLTIPSNLTSGKNYDMLIVGISGNSTADNEHLYPLLNITLNVL